MSRQGIFYHDNDYCNMEKFVEIGEDLQRKNLSRQANVCRDIKRISICRDKVMYVTSLKEEETLVVTDKQSRNM